MSSRGPGARACLVIILDYFGLFWKSSALDCISFNALTFHSTSPVNGVDHVVSYLYLGAGGSGSLRAGRGKCLKVIVAFGSRGSRTVKRVLGAALGGGNSLKLDSGRAVFDRVTTGPGCVLNKQLRIRPAPKVRLLARFACQPIVSAVAPDGDCPRFALLGVAKSFLGGARKVKGEREGRWVKK